MNHFIKLSDFTREELAKTLLLARKLKLERQNNMPHPLLAGKKLGMIFEKSSTRTRLSFEVGMYELGGTGIFLSHRDLQIGRGEPIADTARVMSRYLDAVMIRANSHQTILDFAEHGSIPVINGLCDLYHPCQIMADLMTIEEYFPRFDGVKKVCYIGDGNNVANSLIVGCVKMGLPITIVCPKGYEPNADIAQWAATNGDYTCTNDVFAGAAGAQVVYTDVWTSMGQEEESARRLADFAGFQVNADVMAKAHKKAIVLHCLPAHREEEITTEVFEKHAKPIFDQAENRLHAQKAVLVMLLAEDKLN